MVASKLHTFQVPMKRWNRARPINDLRRLSSPFVRLDSWTVCVNSPLFRFQRWRRRRTGRRCSSSHGGGSRGSPSRRWWMPTRRWVPSSTSCPSAPSSSPWTSSITPSTAPSSTTPPSCLCTEEPQPSTGERESSHSFFLFFFSQACLCSQYIVTRVTMGFTSSLGLKDHCVTSAVVITAN